MESTARLFNCARCRCQVVICSNCDRGHRYCSTLCAHLARTASLHAAGKRYQTSLKGRLKHADRQRQYRHKSQKVTHHSSPPPTPNASLSTPSMASEPSEREVPGEVIHCHFCGCRCSHHLRLDFLHRLPSPSAFDRDLFHWPRRNRAQGP
jgi:hypothetical protein